MTDVELKTTYYNEFVKVPWSTWPTQVFPSNFFNFMDQSTALEASTAWNFFEYVESIDAEIRIRDAGKTIFPDGSRIWYDITFEPTLVIYKYGQILHSRVCPEISWNSQRHLGIPPTGTTTLSLELLTTQPLGITSVIAFPRNRAALVAWQPSVDTSVVSYRITSNPGNIVLTGNYSVLFTNLVNGIPYTFTVESINDLGLSSVSATSNSVIPRTAPTPPLDVSASARILSAIVSWKEPEDTGGGPITSYRVVSSPDRIGITVISDLSGIVTGLRSGVQYTFTVSATNSFGLTSSLASSAPVTVVSIPDPPVITSVTYVTNTLYAIWSPPVNTGGSPILSYTASVDGMTRTGTDISASFTGFTTGTTVTFSVTANTLYGSSQPARWIPIVITGPPVPPTQVLLRYRASDIYVSWYSPPSTFYTVKLLDTNSNVLETRTVYGFSASFTPYNPDVPYRSSVSATNAYGTSAATLSFSAPSKPTGLSILVSDSSASLSWSPPLYDGSSAILDYKLRYNGISISTLSTNRTITGLINGSTYRFSVLATNAYGESLPTLIEGTPLTIPSVPIGVYTIVSPKTITVSWSPPAYNGGSALTRYTVSCTDISTNSLIDTKTVSIYDSLQSTFQNLINGRLYEFTVTVFTGFGSNEETINGTPYSVPDPPVDLSGANIQDTIVLTWKPPIETGGLPILRYEIERSPGCATVITSDLTAVFNNLTLGSVYSFFVYAVNRIGKSLAAQLVFKKISVPSIPTGIALQMGNKTATVTWSPPSVTGGVPITGYTVTSLPSGTLQPRSPLDLTATFIDLSNNTLYTFFVTASNEGGTSNPVQISGTTASAPPAPTNLVAVPGSQSVSLTWNAPSNGGSPITGYTVTSSPSDGLLQPRSPLDLTATFTGLTNGTIYTFSVTATNAVGISSPSTVTSTPVSAPSAPTNLVAVPGNQSVSLTWNAPSNGGSPLTGYTITSSPSGLLQPRSPLDLTATFTGLTNGTIYTFSVTATNAVGISSPSTVTSTPNVVIIPLVWDGALYNYGAGFGSTVGGLWVVFEPYSSDNVYITQQLGSEYGGGRNVPILENGHITGQSNLGPTTPIIQYSYYCVWIAPVNNATVKEYLIRQIIVSKYNPQTEIFIENRITRILSESAGVTKYAYIMPAPFYEGTETIHIYALDINGAIIGNSIFTTFTIPEFWIYQLPFF